MPATAGAETSRLIGFAGPRDGIYADQTAAMRDGVAAAVRKLNAKAAAADKISIVEADDGCDAKRSEETARAFTAEKVAVVIGHPCQSAAIAAARVYAQSGTLFIATATYAPNLTDPPLGAGIYRLSAREDHQARDTATYLMNRKPSMPIMLVHDRTRYGAILVKGVEAQLGSKGQPPAAVVEIVAGELAYPRVAEAAARTKASRIYFAGFPAEARLIRLALDRAGLSNVAIVLSDAAGASPPAAGAQGQSQIVTMRMRRGEPGDAAAELHDALSGLSGRAVELWHSGALSHSGGGSLEVVFDASGDVEWPSFEALEWDGEKWKAARPSPAAHSLSAP